MFLLLLPFSGYPYLQQQASLQNHPGLIHPHLMPGTATTTAAAAAASTTSIPDPSLAVASSIIYQPSSISTPNSPSLKMVARRGVSCSANATPQLARKNFDNEFIGEENIFPGNGGPSSNTQQQQQQHPAAAVDKSEFAKVSEDMNELVYHLNTIQHDISELAGRPISIYDSSSHQES